MSEPRESVACRTSGADQDAVVCGRESESSAALKALAARCLVKDLETRLQIVDWSDFALEGAHDPLARLRGRLEAPGDGFARRLGCNIGVSPAI